MAKRGKIADIDELMEFLTTLIRTEEGSPGGIRAAELLAKILGILSGRSAATAEIPRIIDDIMPADGGEGGAPDG